MQLSLAFTAFVAVVPAFANAIPSRMGAVIPLNHNAVSIMDKRGVANSRMLGSLATRTVSKFGRSFRAYEKNTGITHPLARSASGDVYGRENGSGVPPPANGPNAPHWYVAVSIGNPPQSFSVLLDTASSDVIVPGPSCVTCQGHKIYDTAASSTAEDLGKQFTLGFNDGSSIQGEVFTDTVAVAGVPPINQSVGAATLYPSNLATDEFIGDGILGVARAEISVLGTESLFENLVAEGNVKLPYFSVKLATNDSELLWGSSNPRSFTGEFTLMNVTQPGFWQVLLDSANVGDQEPITGVQAILDTSIPIILAPEQDVVNFYKAIPGSKNATDTVGQGAFTFPCNIDPQVSLTLSGKRFAFPMDSFNVGQATPGSTDCVGGIMAVQDIDFWILGTRFLSTQYMRFDVDAKQVGFATLA